MSDLFPGFHAGRHPDRLALVMAETGDAMTYAELHRFAAQTAHALSGLGLRPGDHVAFCLENRLEYPALIWGAHYAGLHYTPINTHTTAEEFAYIVEDSGARVVFVSAAVADLVEALPDDPGRTILSVGERVKNAVDLESLLAGQPGTTPDEATEGSEMLYTSGTTGRPKGVKRPLSGQPLGSNSVIAMMGKVLLGMTVDSVYLSPAPLYHAAPCKWVQGVTSIGATAVVMARFHSEEALAAIERYEVTHSQWVPTMLQRMVRLDPARRERYDLSSHRVALHGAAPCPVPVKQAVMEWWGPILYEYYGGSEGVGATFCGPEDWLARPGTVGRAVLGQLHVVGDDGAEVPSGSEGLVCFSGGLPFEYHRDPAKTAGARTPQGWSTLGDIGRMDAEGFLYLTDRRDHVIIRGGVNIYPQEVENLLATHPKVADVAVLGVPDDEYGEELKAVVQLLDETDAGPELAADLIAFCHRHFSSIKCPRTVDFRPDLPRQPNGKLYKRQLRDEYWAGRDSRLV